jgi:hypothetical protein
MPFPSLFAESDRKVDRAEAVRARLIPVITTAPPIRTFRRDMPLISFVFASGIYVFDLIGAVTSPFSLPEIYDSMDWACEQVDQKFVSGLGNSLEKHSGRTIRIPEFLWRMHTDLLAEGSGPGDLVQYRFEIVQ